MQHHNVKVIGNDMDLLVLLIDMVNHQIPTSHNNTLHLITKHFVWDIIRHAAHKKTINEPWVKYILFTHAFLGCDSRSRIQNVSKRITDSWKRRNYGTKLLYFIIIPPLKMG